MRSAIRSIETNRVDRKPDGPPLEDSSGVRGYWNYASDSVQSAASSTYSTVSSMLSSIYYDSSESTPSQPMASKVSRKDLAWILQNPYNTVRGRNVEPTSLSAVRSLLTVVPQPETPARLPAVHEESQSSLGASGEVFRRRPFVSDAETASQLAEGTLRALRDMTLEEGVQLHQALRYWNDRWERPALSWLEAGPMVWFSPDGYNHKEVGQRVSQIQAVVARRCAAIGQLQQHLLRAGWQKGVAQWGVLGQGGQWAAVAGFDGSIGGSERSMIPPTPQPFDRAMSSDLAMDELRQGRRKSEVAVMVRQKDGGGIFVENPGFLAEWSVGGILLVREQLFRAANGLIMLPFEENWQTGSPDDLDNLGLIISEPGAPVSEKKIPKWAYESSCTPARVESGRPGQFVHDETEMKICDLPLMVTEVTELLDIMEDVMTIQRRRRLEVFRPPRWLRRNWYLVSTVAPTICLFGLNILRQGHALQVVKMVYGAISTFFRERLRDPTVAIVQELWKGRERFSDDAAMRETVTVLKQMIAHWLEDFYPDMPKKERDRLTERMDISLIEHAKEERLAYLANPTSFLDVLRMSFIEIHSVKKDMMNALNAMDEMMSANDINMNIAAITPVFMLSYFGSRVFKFLYYVFLKLGKSREETYATFRNVLNDVERLLTMRDNPPSSDDSPSSYGPCILGRDDLGMLMLLIHECRTILWRNRRRFGTAQVQSVLEDLAELSGERGAVSVQQQIQIINRMVRTYPFLQSTGHVFQYSSVHHRID